MLLEISLDVAASFIICQTVFIFGPSILFIVLRLFLIYRIRKIIGITEKSGSEYWSCNINRFRNSRRNRTKILWFCSDVCINTLTIYRGVYFPTKMNFFPSSPSLSLSTCIKTIHLNKFIRTFFNINSLIANKF